MVSRITLRRLALAGVTAAAFGGLAMGAARAPDIAFNVKRIDPGFSETAAVADINKDGKPDIISSGAWYEGPTWTKHVIREYDNWAPGFDYLDNFTDLPMDVDGDGWIDDVQFAYNKQNITWLKNPGKAGGEWKVTEIDNSGPTEFAFAVDLDNDGKKDDLLPEFDRANVPAAWFEYNGHGFTKHVVSDKSYGHGIGAGDMNGDGRNDILTPQGWLEAPADVRAPGNWTFHPLDWNQHPITAAGTRAAPPAAPAGAASAAGGGRGGAAAPAAGAAPAAPAPGAAAGAAPATPAQIVPRNGTAFAYIDLRDLNGDGRKDMITGMAHDYGVAWYEQTADGRWIQHVIDNTWSQSHANAWADLNGDGNLDYISGKRFYAHNGGDPGERDPLGVYWYEYRKAPAPAAGAAPARGGGNGGVEWARHFIAYNTSMGGGIQIQAVDLDGDGDIDIVAGGKDGLYIAENMTKSPKK